MSAKSLLHQVQAFFQCYLGAQRGLSANTVLAYRDALKLLLTFISQHHHKPVTEINASLLQPKTMLLFLNSLETQRRNSIVTRNQRLAALRTFFKYLAAEDPIHAGQYQRIVAIPLKQRPSKEVVYLEISEVKTVIDSIDRRSAAGRRDYCLLNVLYNTGARVQELCDLKVRDLRLAAPAVATLTGKGRKTRHVPLWRATADLLRAHCKERAIHDRPDAWVFLNARGKQLGRFGVRHIVRNRVTAVAARCPALHSKRITPHTFRHTTAMHLLQSGVDLAVIKSWLGHVNITTTQDYVEIDMEMKRKALSTCSTNTGTKRLDRVIAKHQDVIDWLKSMK